MTSLGYDLTLVPHEIVEWYLSLKGSSTYQVDVSGWALLLGLGINYWCFY